jgi:hypothetical protein
LPKREKVAGDWRRLHNEELYDAYCTPNITWMIKSRIMRWVGHTAHMGERRGTYRVLMEKLDIKRPLGRSRHRWNYSIATNLKEVGWEDVGWIYLAQLRDK